LGREAKCVYELIAERGNGEVHTMIEINATDEAHGANGNPWR